MFYNRFMHLHSEVLRYLSSASTIRTLFEYPFITISGYAFRIYNYSSNSKRNNDVTANVTIYTAEYCTIIDHELQTQEKISQPMIGC